MADIKLTKPTATKVETPKLKADNSPMFSKGNYLLMAAGAVIIIIGMMIMAVAKATILRCLITIRCTVQPASPLLQF